MTAFTGTVMAIDPSGMGSDETAYAIVKYLHGTLYLVDAGGFTDGFSEVTLSRLAAAAKKHGVNYVIAEENYGGGMFNQLLKPFLNRLQAGKFDDDWKPWAQTQKELRIINTLLPILEGHRLVVDRKVIEADLKVQEETPRYSFVQQFTRIHRAKGALPNDDRLDAVAMACAYWTERMDRDRDKALKNHKDELMEEELKRFMDHAFGFSGHAPTWM